MMPSGWPSTGGTRSASTSRRLPSPGRLPPPTAPPSPGAARFEAVDLEHWSTDDEYDLVTASFFHSPVALTRASILRTAASRVVPGGHLLIVTHAAVPPWAPPEMHADHNLLTPDEEIAQLDLDLNLWDVRIKELRPRETVDPEGRAAIIDDGVVLLQRRSPLLPRRRLQER
ncbi:hypothetical protein [Zhihengliuella salsuginis]|uniref:hypothetical protein n=1 Tax=Zhihengliuella salsuginis TaxID=578222 RepID=UPI001E4CDF44|nr:hypothetical protein [Zhihengliuella salsuginis]